MIWNLLFRVFFIICLFSSICSGDPLKQVVSTSPSWDTFTNKDGTGLYHEILENIFSPLGIEVIHKYTNGKRGIYMVQRGQADLYTCRPDVEGFPDLVLGRYQMYENRFHAIFKKSSVKEWKGQDSLEGRKVVWRRNYYNPSEFKVKMEIFEADSGTSALIQVILDRVAFYIDDQRLINQSISELERPFDTNSYLIKPVGRRAYHPVFKISERGKQIMKLYDSGMKRMHNSGQLKKIFDKWNHPYPDYDM